LSYADAALVAITYMEMAHPKDLERQGEWRKMAEQLKIPMEEDPDLRAERRRKVQDQLEAMFGPPIAAGTTTSVGPDLLGEDP
jgi:hypothetical protein